MRLYGFLGGDIEQARLAIESSLGMHLAAHDSLYLGSGFYRGASVDGLLLTLRPNIDLLYCEGVDPPEERYAEPTFPDATVLLDVEVDPASDARSSYRLHSIPGIVFLRQQD